METIEELRHQPVRPGRVPAQVLGDDFGHRAVELGRSDERCEYGVGDGEEPGRHAVRLEVGDPHGTHAALGSDRGGGREGFREPDGRIDGELRLPPGSPLSSERPRERPGPSRGSRPGSRRSRPESIADFACREERNPPARVSGNRVARAREPPDATLRPWRVLTKLSSCQQVSEVPSTERVCRFTGTAVRSKESEEAVGGKGRRRAGQVLPEQWPGIPKLASDVGRNPGGEATRRARINREDEVMGARRRAVP